MQKYPSAIPIPNTIPHSWTTPEFRTYEQIAESRGKHWLEYARAQAETDWKNATSGYKYKLKKEKGIRNLVILADNNLLLSEKQERRNR